MGMYANYLACVAYGAKVEIPESFSFVFLRESLRGLAEANVALSCLVVKGELNSDVVGVILSFVSVVSPPAAYDREADYDDDDGWSRPLGSPASGPGEFVVVASKILGRSDHGLSLAYDEVTCDMCDSRRLMIVHDGSTVEPEGGRAFDRGSSSNMEFGCWDKAIPDRPTGVREDIREVARALRMTLEGSAGFALVTVADYG
jgi:hypothetical protein